ncbi:MAG TPA: GcrA family cell cycle regulator [Acetobacteraceae bacterium]|nr:GcrA family cell cycle regulator [Acetobacteraceae bacterium]
MEWAEETIVRLRTLWDEGLSTAEIGRRLGVSKNAVVGKAHRLDLPARPSPIRRDGSGPAAPRRSAPRRLAGPTLPPLSSTSPIAASGGGPTMLPHMPAPAPRPVHVPPPHRVAAPAPRYGRIVTCCWPLGDPGTQSFRFCDLASEPGKPYCSDHVKLAYVRVRDRREDAA